jgi:hypothetical protein
MASWAHGSWALTPRFGTLLAVRRRIPSKKRAKLHAAPFGTVLAVAARPMPHGRLARFLLGLQDPCHMATGHGLARFLLPSKNHAKGARGHGLARFLLPSKNHATSPWHRTCRPSKNRATIQGRAVNVAAGHGRHPPSPLVPPGGGRRRVVRPQPHALKKFWGYVQILKEA